MIVNLYSVRDSITTYKLPWPARNDADALRTFRNTVSDPSSDLYRIRNDVQLWHVGEYNDETGEISGKLEFITNGGDVCDVGEK